MSCQARGATGERRGSRLCEHERLQAAGDQLDPLSREPARSRVAIDDRRDPLPHEHESSRTTADHLDVRSCEHDRLQAADDRLDSLSRERDRSQRTTGDRRGSRLCEHDRLQAAGDRLGSLSRGRDRSRVATDDRRDPLVHEHARSRTIGDRLDVLSCEQNRLQAAGDRLGLLSRERRRSRVAPGDRREPPPHGHARSRTTGDRLDSPSCTAPDGRRRHASLPCAVLAFALVLVAGCRDRSTETTSPPLARVLAAILTAADDTTVPWRCAAGDVPALPEREHTVGARTWRTQGNALRREGGDGALVIGVVADAAGATPRTIAALGRLRQALDEAKADLVITLGGMGATQDELVATLGTLADRARWPLVALPGDLEPMAAHLGAITVLENRGDAVFDGRLVRWIELRGATIGTLPGAGAVERLVAGGEGCGWQPADVAQLYSELTARRGLRIAVTSEAPRRNVDGDPAGERGLAPSKAHPIELVVHGPLQPTPTAGRGGARDGAAVTLSPGTADATPRLPRAHHPSAGLLTLRGTSWAWRPVVDAN
jgi:hypothetical protein